MLKNQYIKSNLFHFHEALSVLSSGDVFYILQRKERVILIY